MKSEKKVKTLEEIIKPFRITFPVTIEGAIGTHNFVFRKGEEVILSEAEYELLTNSDYAKCLD